VISIEHLLFALKMISLVKKDGMRKIRKENFEAPIKKNGYSTIFCKDFRKNTIKTLTEEKCIN
jgi:hypothetical protein